MSEDRAERLALRTLRVARANLLAARDDLVERDTSTIRRRFISAHETILKEAQAWGQTPITAEDPVVAKVLAECKELYEECSCIFQKLPPVPANENEPLSHQEDLLGAAAGPKGAAAAANDVDAHQDSSGATETDEGGVPRNESPSGLSEVNRARIKLELERVEELVVQTGALSEGDAVRKELQRAINLVYDNKTKLLASQSGGETGGWIRVGARMLHVWDYLREYQAYYCDVNQYFNPAFIPTQRTERLLDGDGSKKVRLDFKPKDCPADNLGLGGGKKMEEWNLNPPRAADNQKRQAKSSFGNVLDGAKGLPGNVSGDDDRSFWKEIMIEALRDMNIVPDVRPKSQGSGATNVKPYNFEKAMGEEAAQKHQFGPNQWDEFRTYHQGNWGYPTHFQQNYVQSIEPPENDNVGLLGFNNNNNNINNNNFNPFRRMEKPKPQPPTYGDVFQPRGNNGQCVRPKPPASTIFNCMTKGDYDRLKSVSEVGVPTQGGHQNPGGATAQWGGPAHGGRPTQWVAPTQAGLPVQAGAPARAGPAPGFLPNDQHAMVNNGQFFPNTIAEIIQQSTRAFTQDQRDANILTRLQSCRPKKLFDKGKEGLDFEVHLAKYMGAMNQCGASDEQRLSELQWWFTGASYNTVERYIFTEDPDQAVRGALTDLMTRFGRKADTAEEMLHSMMDKKPIGAHDHDGIMDFISQLDNMYQLAVLTNRSFEFDRKVVLATIVRARLPMWKTAWNAKYVKNEVAGNPPLVFKDLLKFLSQKQKEAVENDSPTFQGFGASSKSEETTKTTRQSNRTKFWRDKKANERQVHAVSSESTSSQDQGGAGKDGSGKGKGKDSKKDGNKGPCGYCQGKTHSAISCLKFQQLSLSDRRDKGTELGMCFRCGRLNHLAKGCPEKGSLPSCAKCNKGHNALFCDPQLATSASTQK